LSAPTSTSTSTSTSPSRSSGSSDLGLAEQVRGDPGFQLLLRTHIDRETDLVGQRTAWVMASQAFLFSAYAVAVNGHADASSPKGGTRSALLVAVIPWLSLLSLLLLVVTIVGGLFALVRLRSLLLSAGESRVRALDAGPFARLAGLAAPLLVPVTFLVAWIVLLAHS
jgi:hypothetical protein